MHFPKAFESTGSFNHINMVFSVRSTTFYRQLFGYVSPIEGLGLSYELSMVHSTNEINMSTTKEKRKRKRKGKKGTYEAWLRRSA